jgi:hypothetical protein
MEIEYQITPEDLFAFQWRAAYRSKIGKRARFHLYFYLFLALFLLAILPAIGADGVFFSVSRISFAFLLITFPVMAGLTWLLDKWQTRRVIRTLVREEKADRGSLGRHKVVLSDAGVYEETDIGENRTTWSGVDRVEQNDAYIFLYTLPHNAHVIPKRAFATSGEAAAFYEFARSRRESVRQ